MDTRRVERENAKSVLSTVEKFEAIKIVHRTPLDPPPVIVKVNAKPATSPPPPPQKVDTDDDASSSDLGLPPPVPATPPPADDTEFDFEPPKSKPTSVSKVSTAVKNSMRKPKKKSKSLEESAEDTNVKKEPDLSQLPRKSSLKKSKSKSFLEVKLPGLWFNMDDQYPVPNFSGREEILESIHNVVHGQKSRDVRPISRTIALVGKSGMGKTEIVRKFAFKFYADSNGVGNVVWFDASSRQSIIETLLRLYDKELKCYDIYEQYASTPEISNSGNSSGSPSKDNKKPNSNVRRKNNKQTDEEELNEKIQRILRHRVFQDNHTLFIFDDATQEEDILDFLPNLSPVGHIPSILVTSVHPQNWNNTRVFHVNEFEFKEAVDFLTNNLQAVPGFTRFQAEDLAKGFHRFPRLLQRVKRMIDNQLEASDWALARLEKNMALVRRLKAEGVIRSKAIEIAALSVDRSHFATDDPYVSDFDGELRAHPVSMIFHRAEAIIAGFEDSHEELSVLAVNEDAYLLAVLAFAHPNIKIVAAYGSELSRDEIELIKMQLNLEGIISLGNVKIHPVETSTKGKQHKISPVLDKLRSTDSKVQYNLIVTNLLDEVDLKPIKRLLKLGGRFVTSMSTATVSQVLKKVDAKKLEVHIMKHDFPELLLTATRNSSNN